MAPMSRYTSLGHDKLVSLHLYVTAVHIISAATALWAHHDDVDPLLQSTWHRIMVVDCVVVAAHLIRVLSWMRSSVSTATRCRVESTVRWIEYALTAGTMLSLHLQVKTDRYLGAEEFGIYELSTVLMQLFGALSDPVLFGMINRSSGPLYERDVRLGTRLSLFAFILGCLLMSLMYQAVAQDVGAVPADGPVFIVHLLVYSVFGLIHVVVWTRAILDSRSGVGKTSSAVAGSTAQPAQGDMVPVWYGASAVAFIVAGSLSKIGLNWWHAIREVADEHVLCGDSCQFYLGVVLTLHAGLCLLMAKHIPVKKKASL